MHFVTPPVYRLLIYRIRLAQLLVGRATDNQVDFTEVLRKPHCTRSQVACGRASLKIVCYSHVRVDLPSVDSNTLITFISDDYPDCLPLGVLLLAKSPQVFVPGGNAYCREEIASRRSSYVLNRFRRLTSFKVCTVNFEGLYNRMAPPPCFAAVR